MLKHYLKALIKAYQAAASSIEQYLKGLEERGYVFTDHRNDNLAVDIAMTHADKAMEETLECELSDKNSKGSSVQH